MNTPKRLTLTTETLRVLGDEESQAVAGARVNTGYTQCWSIIVTRACQTLDPLICLGNPTAPSVRV